MEIITLEAISKNTHRQTGQWFCSSMFVYFFFLSNFLLVFFSLFVHGNIVFSWKNVHEIKSNLISVLVKWVNIWLCTPVGRCWWGVGWQLGTRPAPLSSHQWTGCNPGPGSECSSRDSAQCESRWSSSCSISRELCCKRWRNKYKLYFFFKVDQKKIELI